MQAPDPVVVKAQSGSTHPQGARTETIALRLVHGRYFSGSAGPKRATTGVPTSAARCMGPESTATAALAPAITARLSRSDSLPARTAIGTGLALAISSATWRSSSPPTYTVPNPSAAAPSANTAALRAGQVR